MALKAQGQITIVDLSDSRQLSAYLTSDLPKTQIYDPNNNSYAPNWSATNLHITPTIYINQTPLALTTSGLAISWKRKEGSSAETALTSNETVSGNALTVNANKMASITSNMLTYIAYVSYADPETKQTINTRVDITYSLIKHAVNVHDVSIDGEQVFKYDKTGVLVGSSQITLTASATNVNISKWQYKNSSGAWVDYPTTSDNATISGGTLIVKPSHTVFNNNVATIRVITSDSNVTDIISIAKIYDGATGQTGAAGASGYTLIMSNEAQVISANANGACTATTITSVLTAYKGITKVTPTVATPTNLPSGMTFNQSTSGNDVTLKFVVASNATLGGADSGTINISITIDGKAFTKTFSWSKSKVGATGATGQNAIVFSVYAPKGTLVQNGEGTVTLEGAGYDGSTPITSGATYQWAKLVNGNYTNITNATSKSLTINGADVVNIQTYKCTMTYKGKSYVDVITVEDKTDSLVATIISTGGTVFKNKLGDSTLTCILYANGRETDELITENISTTAPSSPSEGTFWYKIDKGSKTIALQKYSGGKWNTASEKQDYTYNWYRMDKNGNAVDTTKPFKTGKVIYINASDIDSKTTFNIEVEDNG